MLVSLKEVNKYVSLEGLDASIIAKGLTFAGTEVEEILPMASGTNLIIGEIVHCQDHPDSDHLHVLRVNLGEKYGVQQIVCGAPNAREGLKVIVKNCKQSDPFDAENFFVFMEIYTKTDGRIFSGWMNRNEPGENPLQNDTYDVWVERCE